jgi:hypothetical protein
MRQNSGRFDWPIGTEHAQDGRGSGCRGYGSNPKGSGRRGLQLRIHSTQARTAARRLSRDTRRVRRIGSRGRGTLGWGNWSAIGLSEANANRLTVGHANVSSKTIEDILLGTDRISLVYKVDKAALLQIRLMSDMPLPRQFPNNKPSLAITSNSQWRRMGQIRG